MVFVIHLRPYQEDAIHQMRFLMQNGCRSILYQGSTGSGKTALTAHMLHTAASRGMRSWFVVHRRELIKQSIDAFNKERLPHGVISTGWREAPDQLTQVASMQSLIRRHHRYVQPNLIVWDEAHHIGAHSWAQLHAQYPGAYHIGLTATPCRLDGKGLGQWFRQLVCGPSTIELIRQGYLSPYRLYAPSQISMQGVPRIAGDYDRRCAEALMDKPTITGDAIQHYQRLAANKRAIVFAVSIEHSKHIVNQFLAAGIATEHVDGETNLEDRDGAIIRFIRGDTKVLSNVDLFGEGFDVPAVEAIIGLRPTQSCGLYLQQIGRGLRPSIFKSGCIILDHAGNALRHGLPDEERQWSLDHGVKSKGDDHQTERSIKICPSCFAAQLPGYVACRFCGFLFEINAREVKQVEGELQEVNTELIRKQHRLEQGMTDDFDALVALGRRRGYRRPYLWAKYIWNARQAKKLGHLA